jgi:S-formylglutathione hydrolase
MSYELIESHKMFGGHQLRFQHESTACRSSMTFSIYIPSQAKERSLPVLYWLSGLTCTDENFTHKAGAQKKAAELGMILVMPDTSPRGESIPNDDAYDLGQGAGFYVNATQAPWSKHFHMMDYITQELPKIVYAVLVANNFHKYSKQGIFGHSMGGHGALTIGLAHPDIYASISAFAPITHPMNCPWGEKAFTHYLGEERSNWQRYDAFELVKLSSQLTQKTPVLIDQGDEDQFLAEQLNFDAFNKLCKSLNYPATCRLQSGYDHSYFFIATFIDEHLEFHFNILA